MASHLGAVQPAADALVERLEWPSLTSFSSFNEVWSFAVDAKADATFKAAVIKAGPTGRYRPAALKARGSLTHERPRTVTFPARTLPPGTYRILLTVTRKHGRPLTVNRTSPAFVVAG
jgi:hypothetical protein